MEFIAKLPSLFVAYHLIIAVSCSSDLRLIVSELKKQYQNIPLFVIATEVPAQSDILVNNAVSEKNNSPDFLAFAPVS